MKKFFNKFSQKSCGKELRDAIKKKKERQVEIQEPSVEKSDLEFNLVIIGDEGVGKSSLLECYAYDSFNPAYNPSIHNHPVLEIENTHPIFGANFPKIIINVNDFSGRDVHRSIRVQGYKKADIIMLCYSLSDGGKSAANLEQKWIINELKERGPKRAEIQMQV